MQVQKIVQTDQKAMPTHEIAIKYEDQLDLHTLSLIHIYAADDLTRVDLGGRRIIKKLTRVELGGRPSNK